MQRMGGEGEGDGRERGEDVRKEGEEGRTEGIRDKGKRRWEYERRPRFSYASLYYTER